ncbi:NLR family CARD domain-containing protein 4-like [Patiria miniata]|uniref:NACHT domain-containing protein n=1 Tax=Patiria miniata TaxID=46514 RepID=A0A914A913_PATMI|nr:NLR family CARD domain-containing protein 4-like [Patiria miniata]
MQQSEAAWQRTDVPTTMQQEAHAPSACSATTDFPPRTGTIGNIGAVGGSNNPTISGLSGVNVTYNFLLEEPGVPSPSPPHSQRPDQDPRLTDSYQEAGKKTRDVLKGVYKTTLSSVNLLPGVDNDVMDIAGIYTKVQLETQDGEALDTCQRGEIVSTTEYSSIFRLRTGRYGKLINRLIFFGMGIVEKSTIFDKIAYDWADESSEILKRFKLVFLLKMCALSQESDLVDSIFDQLLGEKSGIERDELDKFILANPNEVLILVDGFDEMKPKKLNAASFGSILKSLNRRVYKECLICISTRPSHLQTLTSLILVQDPCTHVEVLGLTEEDFNDFVQKFFERDPDIGKALLQAIGKSNTLRYFAKTPVLLFLMCLLWRESKQLPKTTSCLFTEAIDHMFTRKHLSGHYASKTVIAIGQIALRRLTSANQKFSFQEDEFEPKVLELALKAGILTQQRVIKNSKSINIIQFMHKTVQEYCAAKYLQSLNLSSTLGLFTRVKNKLKYQRILSQLCSTFEGVVSNEFLFRFCCGDNEKCMTDIVNLLDRKFNKDKPRYQSSVIQAVSRSCFLESQSAKVPLSLTSDSLIPSTIEVCKNDDFQRLMYLLEITFRSDSCMTQLACVTAISISTFAANSISLVSSVSDLAFALGNMENLRSLRLYRCYLGKGGLGKILSSLKGNQHLTDLYINAYSESAAEWAPHIKHLTSLNRLELACHALGWDSIEHIASAVANMPKLTDLSLAGNRTLGGTVDLWTKELLKMRHLNRLDLSDCYFSSSDIEHIAATVADMPILTDLILADNYICVEGLAELWAKVLPKMTHINRLDLSDMVLNPTDIEHIASGVGDMPGLTDLILAGNCLFGGSAELWAKEFPKMTQLSKLDLKSCSWLPTDIEHIASAVHDMPRLTDLILDNSKALGASAKLWAKELPKMRHLSRLYLSNCNLTPSDIRRVTSAVGDMPSLTDLYLAGNPGLGGLDKLQSCFPSLRVHVETHLP